MSLVADPSYETVLWVLIVAVAVLTALALAFAVTVVLLRLRNERRARQWTRVELELEALLLDAMTGFVPPASVAPRVQPRDVMLFVDLVARYARRVRGAERERLAACVAPVLPRVARRAGHGDAAVRARALQTLALLGLAEHADSVVAGLDDRSPLVAMAAARALASREHPQFAAAILAKMDRFLDWHPGFLAGMLAAIGPAAADALTATLADTSRPPRVRAIAAEALRALNHLAAGDPAAAAVAASPDRDLRASALRLLRQVGRPEHLPAIRAAAAGTDAVVRAQAIAALAALDSPDNLAAHAAALDDPSPWVALQAARALRQARGSDALQRLAASGTPRAALALMVLAEADR